MISDCYIINNQILSIIKRVNIMEIICAAFSLFNFILLLVLLFKKQLIGVFSKKNAKVLMYNSSINIKALKNAGLSVDELMSRARIAGYFNLGDIDTAILEPCGEISFLAAPMKRSLNPRDFNFAPVREGLCRIIISDGRIIKENLFLSGISEEELFNLLSQRGSRLDDIFLATANEAGRVDFFDKYSC